MRISLPNMATKMDSSKSDDLAELSKCIKQRGLIKGRLTKFSEYLTNLQKCKPSEISSAKYRQLELKINKLQPVLNEFDELQNKIDLLHSDSAEQIKERDDIENQFLSFIAIGQDILESWSSNKEADLKQDDRSSMESCRSNSCNAIKLPTIKLPTFDGNYLRWLEFKDSFESMINNNNDIPPINKFHYLRSSLEGSASVVIKSIELSSSNYSMAWDLLCDRYNNKNILINNHLKALFTFETISKESFKALRFVVDHFSKHLRALDSLGQPTDKWDALIIFMVSSKLDINTSRKWEEYKCNLKDLPTLNEFYAFLRGRADVLETSYTNQLEKVDHRFVPREYKPKFNNNQCKSLMVSVNRKSNNICEICNDSHRLYECLKFKEMNIDDRSNVITKLQLCKNCFRGGHRSFQCNLKSCCRVCKKKHNTLLHRDAVNTDKSPPLISSPPVSLSVVSANQVLLCTALVDIVYNNNIYTARALLDTGSQSSFITSNLKGKLGLNGNSINSINICGINNVSCNISESVYLKITSRVSSYELEVNCLIIPKITGLLPNSQIDTNDLNLPTGIELADPTFCCPAEIDILLGANVYWNIIKSNIIKLGVNKPVLQDSKLGWLVAGPIINSQPTPNTVCNFSQEIRDSLEKFWVIDELPTTTKTYSPEEQFCEQHFVNNHTRLPSGRFSVQIPMKEVPEEALGENYYIAKKCLENLEKKFIKHPNLKLKYKEFLKEYADLGHLTKIERPKFGYYMPHHAVVREKSETTKLRVVFNGSFKTSTRKSLNDIQRIGPIVQSDLISLLLRFRQHKFILIADIEKMYRQVEIDPAQRHLQLILWRNERDQPIEVLQLNTVTYGTASAPFLSTRCLLQLALECPDSVISNVIQNDFYVDDLNTGADTVRDLEHIANGVVKVLQSACLPLRKIRTNCSQLLINDIDSSESFDINKESSVLGLKYCPKSDTLQFSRDLEPTPVCTKRSIVSTTCKIFDPLGLLCPCVIVAKILLQRLWSAKLEWDEPVPNDFVKHWLKLLREFSFLSQIKIPRRVLCENPITIELHCFVDASQQAYAACVYLRSESVENSVVVNLLCAKARVAPIKTTTIPRLELCGALLGARLCSKVCQSLRCNIKGKFLWTDSTVVLGWLKTQSKDLKAFVCNRVNEINELTSGYNFKHVSTDQNPADMASRGVHPKFLHSNSVWWEGPSFLKLPADEWPKQKHVQISSDLPDRKMINNSYTIKCNVETSNGINNNFLNIDKYSNFNKLVRIYAYVLRFINNCQKPTLKLTEALDVEENDKSLKLLIKCSQSESFCDEIQTVLDKKALPRKSKLLSLTPFVDSFGILRASGRIQNSEFEYEKKHPAILDAKHHLTKLIMSHEHLRLFHAGPQLLLASVRERFWPIGGRNLARSTTRRCLVCTRLRGKTLQPIMGNLPAERSSPSFAFYSCGVDMAGPFMISSKKGKGNRISKCYLCLFVCLATKAVHLELVSDLSTEAFILSLRRFVSRRGKPSIIFSDNGSNFKGANNELNKLLRSSRQSIANFANDEGIKFKFSPAYSPHFGGIWEAGIKSAKYHLHRIAGNASLTFEELATLFAQIEAILNSRPLTPLSSDPTDPAPLTPGHFLIGRPLTSLPSLPVTTKHPNRYERIEQLRQHFWERWRQEFVAELQQRTKWQVRQKELRVGDLVILKEDQLPPLQWRLARVTCLYPGPDGVSRVADVLTNRGTIRRAVNKMCIIPTADEEIKEVST